MRLVEWKWCLTKRWTRKEIKKNADKEVDKDTDKDVDEEVAKFRFAQDLIVQEVSNGGISKKLASSESPRRIFNLSSFKDFHSHSLQKL